jgi:hypothetical protein
VLEVWQVAAGLQRWATEGVPFKKATEQYPAGEGGGAWLSLCWFLDGRKSWLVSSADLVWPEGSNEDLWGHKVADLSAQPAPNRRRPSPAGVW